MTSFSVRRIRPEEWQLYRAVRLRALRDAPDAFGSTYADSIKYSDDQWQKRLANASPATDLPLFAERADTVVGLAWGKFEPPDSNVAHLFQMWVAPEARRSGIGRVLVDAVIEWATGNGARSIELSVTAGNSAARRLYEAVGFITAGDPQPLREGSTLLEHAMALTLPSRGRPP